MIRFAEPQYGAEEHALVCEVFRDGQFSEGPKCEAFQRAMFDRFNRFVTLTSSGTTALHVALLAAGVGPGDEVILPATTYIATMNAVMYCGATPVVVDVDTESWVMCEASLARAITEKTKAVIPVHLYGVACASDLRGVIDKHYQKTGQFITIIADRAEDFSDHVSRADIDVFSFYASKTITTGGEGGAVLCADYRHHARVSLLVHQATAGVGTYKHECLGFNYRMTELQAAFGLAQFAKFDDFMAKRRQVFQWYHNYLTSSVAHQKGPMAGFWAMAVVSNEYGTKAREVAEELANRGIETRPVFPSVARAPHFTGRTVGSHMTPDLLHAYGLVLPTHCGLAEDDVIEVCRKLGELVG